MTDDPRWAEVDAWASSLLIPTDEALTAAIRRSAEAGLPDIQVTASLGRLLELLVRIRGAKRVLEIGTLGGFSTIFLARGVAPDGEMVTLELEPAHASVARANLADAGVSDRVEIIVGDAHASLAAMAEDSVPAFDFVFLDAEKSGYPAYLDALHGLLRPGSVVVADNVVRRGAVVDPEWTDVHAAGVRSFVEAVGSHPGLSASVIQTVGSKGYDGLLIAVVE